MYKDLKLYIDTRGMGTIYFIYKDIVFGFIEDAEVVPVAYKPYNKEFFEIVNSDKVIPFFANDEEIARYINGKYEVLGKRLSALVQMYDEALSNLETYYSEAFLTRMVEKLQYKPSPLNSFEKELNRKRYSYVFGYKELKRMIDEEVV